MQWQAAIMNSDFFLCVVDDIQAADTRKQEV